MANTPHDSTETTTTSKASTGDAGGHSTIPPAQQGNEQQPTFNILPYPAKSNDPNENTGGLRSSQSAFQTAPGPVVLDQGMLNNLGPAKTTKELEALQAELNHKP